MAISLAAAITLFYPSKEAYAYTLPKAEMTWSCGSGFPPCSTDSIGICQPPPQPYLRVSSSDQRSLAFTAPKAANYSCTMTVTASYFDYQNTPQNNEKVDIYLNNKKVGSTPDIWCPPGGVEPVVERCGSPRASPMDKTGDNVPGSVGYCDDDPVSARPGEHFEIDRSKCNDDGYVFVRKGIHIPHCQYWKFNQDGTIEGMYNEQTLVNEGAPNIIYKFECSGKSNVSVSLEPGAAYTIGSWSRYADDSHGWSEVIYCNETGTVPLPVPSAPLSLSASASGTTITLTWSPPSSSGSSLITQYNIYRGSSSNGEILLTSVASAPTTYSDTGLEVGKTYYYKVSASNSIGEGPKSNEASATAGDGTPTCDKDAVCETGETVLNCKYDCCENVCAIEVTEYYCTSKTYPCKCIWNGALFVGECLDCRVACDFFDTSQSSCLATVDDEGYAICKWVGSPLNCECKWTGY